MNLKSVWLVSLGVLAFAFLALARDQIAFKTIDGVPHVFNPASPLHGTINLEVERTRTINPYDQPEVGMRMIQFARRETGEVVLYDPNQAEGHRFAANGKYLGLLTKKGQGPGEFGPWSLYHVYYHGPDIWVFGGQKVARLDTNGQYLQERKLKNRCSESIESGRFLSLDAKMRDPKHQVWTLKAVQFSMDGEEAGIDLLTAENIEMIRKPDGQGGFGEEWATPRFFYGAAPDSGRIFCGLNTTYEIRIKDFAGKDILVVQRAYENVKVRKADLEKMLPGIGKDEGSKWILSAYPERYVAVFSISPLPKGYLAVFRVTGPKLFEIDVFNPKGEYIYALVPPAGVKMEDAQFFAAGFATVEQEGDYTVYHEYRIKNLPEIFGK